MSKDKYKVNPTLDKKNPSHFVRGFSIIQLAFSNPSEIFLWHARCSGRGCHPAPRDHSQDIPEGAAAVLLSCRLFPHCRSATVLIALVLHGESILRKDDRAVRWDVADGGIGEDRMVFALGLRQILVVGYDVGYCALGVFL